MYQVEVRHLIIILVLLIVVSGLLIAYKDKVKLAGIKVKDRVLRLVRRRSNSVQ